MTRIASTMLPLGSPATDFTLLDTTSGQQRHLQELKSDIGTVIAFICNHCPFVKHIQDEFVNVANEYQAKGIQFIAISANDAMNYPADAPDKMALVAKQHHYPFPYLYDETQEIACAYQAACTPDFFVFDGKLNCVYRGQFDDSRPMNDLPVTGKDLREALDAILAGQTPNRDQKPSLGCNIKWKSGE